MLRPGLFPGERVLLHGRHLPHRRRGLPVLRRRAWTTSSRAAARRSARERSRTCSTSSRRSRGGGLSACRIRCSAQAIKACVTVEAGARPDRAGRRAPLRAASRRSSWCRESCDFVREHAADLDPARSHRAALDRAVQAEHAQSAHPHGEACYGTLSVLLLAASAVAHFRAARGHGRSWSVQPDVFLRVHGASRSAATCSGRGATFAASRPAAPVAAAPVLLGAVVLLRPDALRGVQVLEQLAFLIACWASCSWCSAPRTFARLGRSRLSAPDDPVWDGLPSASTNRFSMRSAAIGRPDAAVRCSGLS